jgi:hypothetical protein
MSKLSQLAKLLNSAGSTKDLWECLDQGCTGCGKLDDPGEVNARVLDAVDKKPAYDANNNNPQFI